MTAKIRGHHCSNCSAPLEVELGQVEVFCDFCDSWLRILPGEDELAVVRTREEMKYRERVAVQKAILRQKLEREEAERWRQTAAKVAIAAVPLVGRAAWLFWLSLYSCLRCCLAEERRSSQSLGAWANPTRVTENSDSTLCFSWKKSYGSFRVP
jgi:uncharacterized Zn finger protein (UPF0148 family)